MEDEFLLVMMKLRLGLTNLDIAMRFRISEGTVFDIFPTWINFLYVRLGSLKIWPTRGVILDNMPKKIKEEYPNTIIIIDCTEIRIHCPSTLVLQSQSYSNYKSRNTLKSLVGVDSRGGFMFVSQLYTAHDKYFKHFSGFNSYTKFKTALEFIVQDLDRKHIVYWSTKKGKEQKVDTSSLFDSNHSDSNSDEDENDSSNDISPPRQHVLSMEDEFLLVMMKLRLGLTNLDIAMRFRISEGTVFDIFPTWINFLYVRLGSLKIWPTRGVILDNMPKKIKEEYPNTIIIIDCTEIRIHCPSTLVLQSQSYSNYKSRNTLKSLVGVDSRGGFMFVSQLYTGSISDKQIVSRSGFLDVLKAKKETLEALDGDSIMADKGFDIEEDLQKSGLQKTQTIAKHRIHVERAIGKVRNFLIFRSKLPISVLGVVNQIWTVCCLLRGFMEPLLDKKS